jgi:hypothetical protein
MFGIIFGILRRHVFAWCVNNVDANFWNRNKSLSMYVTTLILHKVNIDKKNPWPEY